MLREYGRNRRDGRVRGRLHRRNRRDRPLTLRGSSACEIGSARRHAPLMPHDHAVNEWAAGAVCASPMIIAVVASASRTLPTRTQRQRHSCAREVLNDQVGIHRVVSAAWVDPPRSTTPLIGICWETNCKGLGCSKTATFDASRGYAVQHRQHQATLRRAARKPCSVVRNRLCTGASLGPPRFVVPRCTHVVRYLHGAAFRC
jgi:hypothetical protein